MNNIVRTLIEKEYLSEDDIKKNKNYLSIMFSKVFENIGKGILIFFILLFLIVSIFFTAEVSMPIIAIASLFWLKKSPKNFFPPIILTSSILISLGIYSDKFDFSFNTVPYFIIGFILHNIYCFVLTNSHMQKLYLMVFYTFLLVFTIEDVISYGNYLLMISIVNFIFIIILLFKEDKLRKNIFRENYLIFLIESLTIGFGISIWYEWLNITNIFYEADRGMDFTRGNIILYIVGSVYIIYILRKEKLVKKNIVIINTILALMSIRIPFISFALFLFNLSLYREWFLLNKMSLGLVVMSLFLLYHRISTTFVIKSVSTFSLGILMLVSYVYIKRKGGKCE